MSDYDDAISEGFDQAPVDPFNPPRPKGRPVFDIVDTALAIPRGLVGAAKGVYNLADTLTFDSLPDWDKNPLGESKSTIGGFVEGAVHFTAGFIPFAGVGRFAGLLGKAAEGASIASKAGRVAVASGLAGATAFEGHEARLSDMVSKNAPLVGPLAEFLASNPEDPELIGRLKNGIEQAGLGAVTEGILLGAKAVFAGRAAKTKVLAAGGTPEAAGEAAAEAAGKIATPERVGSAAYLDAGHVDDGVTVARDHAREYASSAVSEFYPPHPDAVKVDPEFAGRLADAYESAVHAPESPGVKASYEALKSETLAQYDFLVEKGVKMEPWTGTGEPYANSAAMRADVRDSNHLYYLPTEATGMAADHPLAAATGRTVGDKPLLYNDAFRAIHDYFGHAAEGNKFGPRGEEVAWQLHARMFTEDALPAMTTETRGQNSWVNYNRALRESGQRVPLKDRPFAEQKAAILPPEFYNLKPTPEDVLGTTGVHDLPDVMQVRKQTAKMTLSPEEEAAFAADAARAYPDLPALQAQAKLGLDEGLQMETALERARQGMQAKQAAAIETGPRRTIRDAGESVEPTPITGEPSAAGGGVQEPPRTADAAGPAPEPTGPAPEPIRTPIEFLDATPAQQRRLPMLRQLGMSDEKIKAFTRKFEATGQAIEDVMGPGAGIPGETAFNPRKLSTADRLRIGLQEADLPMQNFRSPDAANVMQRTLEDFFRTEIEADFAVMAPTTLQEIADDAAKLTAEMLGYKDARAYTSATLVRGGQTVRSLQEALPRIYSDRTILELANQQLVKAFSKMERIRTGAEAGNMDKVAIEFTEALQHSAGMTAIVKGEARLAGRILAIFRKQVGGVEIPPELMRLADDPAQLQKMLQEAGGFESVAKVMEKYKLAWEKGGKDGGHAALAKLQRGTAGSRFLNMTTEFFMGSVLSSPQTWVINGASNAIAQMFLPLERALGSVVVRAGGDKVFTAAQLVHQDKLLGECLNRIIHMKGDLTDAIRMFADAGFDPDSALSKASIFEKGSRAPAITAGNVGLPSDTVGGTMVNWLGRVARVPLDILGGTDVVAKNVYIRNAARARFATEALAAGKTNAVEIATHIETRLSQLIEEGQLHTSDGVIKRGVELAKAAGLEDPEAVQKYVTEHYKANFKEDVATIGRELAEEADVATYTNRPLPGTITYSIQQFVNKHPALRLVAPFINTPMNLLKAAGQRADAVGVARYLIGRKWPKAMPELAETSNRFLRDMLSNDPRRAADAVGRITTGIGASVFFLSEALNGNITGHGPSDPNERAALTDTGWQPYSIKVGDSYISYQRLDPFATFIGTAADMAEYMNQADDLEQEDHATAITGLAIGMANNFTNKSYLTGFANLVGAMQAPEKKVPEFFRRQAAAFVPNILSTAGYGVGQDPNLREVRSFTDALMAKVPYFSKTLPPRRNILGEPLERPAAVEGKDPTLGTLVNLWDPIKYSRVKDDVVRNELAALGHAWEPPKRKMAGVDLMDVPAGKTTAYDRWQELQGTVSIGGRNLKDALRGTIRSPEYRRLTPESVDGLESPRVARLNRIIGDYRAAAWTQLTREVPRLKQHQLAVAASKQARKAGLPAPIIPEF